MERPCVNILYANKLDLGQTCSSELNNLSVSLARFILVNFTFVY